MKITDFEILEVTGRSYADRLYYGVVKVTTGLWFWKKIKHLGVTRPAAGHWFFTRTGEWCPGYQVEALERAYRAQTGFAQ